MNLPISVLILLSLTTHLRAEDAPRGGRDEATRQAGDNMTAEQAREDSSKEEFKFRYKRPKQRHDDDEAPVPKFNQKPQQPDATEAKQPARN
jgi:hypothetical protein